MRPKTCHSPRHPARPVANLTWSLPALTAEAEQAFRSKTNLQKKSLLDWERTTPHSTNLAHLAWSAVLALVPSQPGARRELRAGTRPTAAASLQQRVRVPWKTVVRVETAPRGNRLARWLPAAVPCSVGTSGYESSFHQTDHSPNKHILSP